MSEEELLAEIKEEAKHQRIFVMVSNIDGPSLRSPNVQRGLSELSQIEKVHFGASIDHVNAPLIWDLQMKDRFSWVFHHVPTFSPYVREVSLSSLPSLFLGRKEACTQESAAVVLSSLSNNAREVFRCIADAQLDAENASGGITFQTLFNVCKERFLASKREHSQGVPDGIQGPRHTADEAGRINDRRCAAHSARRRVPEDAAESLLSLSSVAHRLRIVSASRRRPFFLMYVAYKHSLFAQ